MGYMRHDAIVVTSWKRSHLLSARRKAKELGLPVSTCVAGKINAEASFLIAPDGSKEGWTESDAGGAAREAWKEWLRSKKLYVDFAHVNFGGDEPDLATLKDHNGIPF